MQGDDERHARSVLAEMQARLAQGPEVALGVASAATADDVRAAFRTLTKKFHPARFGRMATDVQRFANEVFLGIKLAHEQLLRTVAGAGQGARAIGDGGPTEIVSESSGRVAQPVRGSTGTLPPPMAGRPAGRTGSATTPPMAGRPAGRTGSATTPPAALASRSTGQMPAAVPPSDPPPPGGARRTAPMSAVAPPADAPRRSTQMAAVAPPADGAPVGARRTAQMSAAAPPSDGVPVRAGTAPTQPVFGSRRTGQVQAVDVRTATPSGGVPVRAGTAPPQPVFGSRRTGQVQAQEPPVTTPSSGIPVTPMTSASSSSAGIRAAAVPPPGFDPRSALRSCQILLSQKDWPRACVALAELVANVPGIRTYQAMLAYARGREAAAAGRTQEALSELQRALELNPSMAEATQAIAELQRRG